MTRSNKNRGKKRSLLDEEELTPKTEAWDFFYGRAPLSGAKPPDAFSFGREERATAIPTDPDSVSISSLPKSTVDIETLPSPTSFVTDDNARLVSDSLYSNDKESSEEKSAEATGLPSKQNSNVTKQPLAFKTRQHLIDPSPPGSSAHDVNESLLFNGESSFDDFERAFRKRLTKADLKICKLIFDQTHALGKSTCLMRIDDLVAQVKISKRHLYRLLSELENSGFIERGGIYNTPTKKGIEITFYPIPRLKKLDSARHFHYYDS